MSVRRHMNVSSAPTAFGVEEYEMQPEEVGGAPDTQAGSHPFQLTTTLMLDQTGEKPFQPAQPKDLNFKLPPGLVGNPTPFPQCSEAQFSHLTSTDFNECPADTAIGVAMATVDEKELFGEQSFPVPLFNLVPAPGEPARFGFEILKNPVVLDTSVRTGGDYGITVSANNITELTAFLASRVTFWGVPGDPAHNQSRGWACLFKEPSCAPTPGGATPPLLTLPTSCSGPLQTTMEGDSWADPGSFLSRSYTFQNNAGQPFELDGCNRLSFEPSITVAPDGQAGSTPTGLSVGVHLPQEEILTPNGLAQSDVKDTTVTLPAGVQISPSSADGLQSCSLGEIGLETALAPACPDASKVGTVELKSPLLAEALEGSVYLAAQNANPFGSLVAMYIYVEAPKAGIVIKFAGEVALNEQTGQIVSTFEDTPQLPFEDLKLNFFGGARAPLATPALCGSYTTRASFTPSSGNAPVEPSSTFRITSGPQGVPCADPLPFHPALTAGTTSIQAGGFSPFTMTVGREDGQQDVGALELHMPPGLSGMLSGVELCGEAQADAGTCESGSLIGETTVSVGLGEDPYSVTGGKVYITGPYEGAPFGLSIVVQAVAGPFNLGQVVVRGTIEVNPLTAALTVKTNSPQQGYAIPQILDGIPLAIKHVNFTTTRSGFTFNPTSCDKLALTGTITSDQGVSAAVSSPFQVTDCAALAFKPKLSATTSGRTSRAYGASLDVKLSYPTGAQGSEANIHKFRIELPKKLPSQLRTLRKACLAEVFAANPAGCPSASRVGSAVVHTPVLPVSLTGPAYFVSNGNAKFPELVIVLQGDGVTVDVHAETFISEKGITSSMVNQAPDVPFSSFELKLPEGAYPALAALGDLCKQRSLGMPTELVAQDGAVIRDTTKVAVTGCPKARRVAARHLAARRVARRGRTSRSPRRRRRR